MTTGEPEPAPGERDKKRPRKRAPQQKPLESVLPGQHVKTKTETESFPAELPDERASRLRREEARQSHEIFKEKAILVTSLAVVAVIVLASLGILAFSDKPGLMNWATASLSAVMGGCLGYAVGKRDTTGPLSK